MKRYIAIFAIVCVCLFAGINGAPAGAAANNAKPGAAGAEAVLNNMEAVGRNLSSLVANLWQQKTNTQLGLTDPAETGTIYYQPGKNGQLKLRIDIVKPSKTIVISGDLIKFYQPEARQMLVSSIKDASKNRSASSLAITFGSVSAIRSSYDVTFVKDEKVEGEMASLLHLTPKQHGPYKGIDIWISHSLWLPIQQRLVENNDDVTLVRLSNMKKNGTFDAKKLIDNFNPPNVKIVKG